MYRKNKESDATRDSNRNPNLELSLKLKHGLPASDRSVRIYRDVDGILVPTKRRVYAYEGDYELVKEPLLVAIDMGEITLF